MFLIFVGEVNLGVDGRLGLFSRFGRGGIALGGVV